MNYGQRLKVLRRHLGKSQIEVANEMRERWSDLRVNQQTVIKHEARNESPNPLKSNLAAHFAEYYGITLDQLEGLRPLPLETYDPPPPKLNHWKLKTLAKIGEYPQYVESIKKDTLKLLLDHGLIRIVEECEDGYCVDVAHITLTGKGVLLELWMDED